MFTSFMKCITNDEQVDDANLVWTGDEIQLLLEMIRDFKTDQLYEGIDW